MSDLDIPLTSCPKCKTALDDRHIQMIADALRVFIATKRQVKEITLRDLMCFGCLD